MSARAVTSSSALLMYTCSRSLPKNLKRNEVQALARRLNQRTLSIIRICMYVYMYVVYILIYIQYIHTLIYIYIYIVCVCAGGGVVVDGVVAVELCS
jgi:cellulose synthase/poly-beta-1,6-N-acetylglucosamine synthase-like glycosyltransferase